MWLARLRIDMSVAFALIVTGRNSKSVRERR